MEVAPLYKLFSLLTVHNVLVVQYDSRASVYLFILFKTLFTS